MPIPLLLKDPLNVFPSSSSSRPHFRFQFLVRLSKTTAASSWNSSFILLSLAKSIGNALEGQGTFERSLRRKLILLIPPFEQTGVDEESSVCGACSLMALRLAKSVPTLPIWLSPPRLRSQSVRQTDVASTDDWQNRTHHSQTPPSTLDSGNIINKQAGLARRTEEDGISAAIFHGTLTHAHFLSHCGITIAPDRPRPMAFSRV